MIEQT